LCIANMIDRGRLSFDTPLSQALARHFRAHRQACRSASVAGDDQADGVHRAASAARRMRSLWAPLAVQYGATHLLDRS